MCGIAVSCWNFPTHCCNNKRSLCFASSGLIMICRIHVKIWYLDKKRWFAISYRRICSCRWTILFNVCFWTPPRFPFYIEISAWSCYSSRPTGVHLILITMAILSCFINISWDVFLFNIKLLCIQKDLCFCCNMKWRKRSFFRRFCALCK